MSDPHIQEYRTNLIAFTLPPQLKDKTMHMFTLGDSGPSEFSVVMSHADVQPADTLVDFSETLVTQLQQSLPRFDLAQTRERSLAGEGAIELQYSWRSGAATLYQSQVVALVPGALPDTRQALLVGATCTTKFTDDMHALFATILDSVSLRHQAAPSPPPSLAAVPSTVFALSERRRTLHAFVDREEACSKTDAREVEQHAWEFFDAAGTPLHPQFIEPNSGLLWRKRGKYVLKVQSGMEAAPLRDRLHQAAVFVAGSPAVPYASIADVRAHLDQTREA